MENRRTVFGWVGIGLGSLSLLLALVHFYAGPFSPQPTLEHAVAEKAVAIRQATIAALKGGEIKVENKKRRFDADQIMEITIAVLGALSLILATVGFAKKESYRVAIGAAGLGAAGIAFQFLTIALGVIVVAILVAAVLGSLGLS